MIYTTITSTPFYWPTYLSFVDPASIVTYTCVYTDLHQYTLWTGYYRVSPPCICGWHCAPPLCTCMCGCEELCWARGSDATLAESTLYTIRVWGGWGAVFTSARSAVPPYSLPILASLNWRYHMTGILSTQQEVALQTVCFALFLKLEFNGVGETGKQKEKEKKKWSSVD